MTVPSSPAEEPSHAAEPARGDLEVSGDNPLTPAQQTEERYVRFVSLFTRYEWNLRAFVRSLLPRMQDADEVMQEVGLACWKKFADFTDEGDPAECGEGFIRWACVVSRFEVLRYRRSHARDRLVLSEAALTALVTDSVARVSKAERERQAVDRCLKSLSDPERRLLLSVHTPGDSVAQIAAETGQKARPLYDVVTRLRDRIGDCVRAQMNEQEVLA